MGVLRVMLLLGLSWIGVAPIGALAASPQLFQFESEWRFPVSAYSADLFWTPEDHYIVDVKMIPKAAWTLQQSVLASDGRVLLAAGSQMVHVKAPVPAMCSWGAGPVGTFSEKRKICLFDSNDSGKFDAAFDVGIDEDRSMLMKRKVPDRVLAVSGVSLTPIATTELKDRPRFVMLLQQVILRRRPGNGAEPFYEVRLQAETRNETTWTGRYYLCSARLCNGLNRIGDVVGFAGLSVEITDLKHEQAQARILGSFETRSFREISGN